MPELLRNPFQGFCRLPGMLLPAKPKEDQLELEVGESWTVLSAVVGVGGVLGDILRVLHG